MFFRFEFTSTLWSPNLLFSRAFILLSLGLSSRLEPLSRNGSRTSLARFPRDRYCGTTFSFFSFFFVAFLGRMFCPWSSSNFDTKRWRKLLISSFLLLLRSIELPQEYSPSNVWLMVRTKHHEFRRSHVFLLVSRPSFPIFLAIYGFGENSTQAA